MTATKPEDLHSDRESLDSRIQSLRELMAEQEQQNHKRRRLYIYVGVALVAVCVLSLSSLTRMSFQLDAQALTEIGRMEVEKQMPGGVEKLRVHLKQQAPQLVADLLRSILSGLPELRAKLVSDLTQRTAQATREFEQHLISVMAETVKAGKVEAERLAAPGESDAEKLGRVVEYATAAYSKKLGEAFEALYPDYTRELDRVKSYLVNLQRDESQLSETEKVHKEMLETFLQLMMRDELEARRS
jgi:hypothetical protein